MVETESIIQWLLPKKIIGHGDKTNKGAYYGQRAHTSPEIVKFYIT